MAKGGKNQPFVCPKCGYADGVFHPVCPSCGRPFVREYTDTQVHPRNPDLTGVVTSTFWARVFLVLLLCGIGTGLVLTLRTVLGLYSGSGTRTHGLWLQAALKRVRDSG